MKSPISSFRWDYTQSRREGLFFLILPLLFALLLPALFWSDPTSFTYDSLNGDQSVDHLMRGTLFLGIIGGFVALFHFSPFYWFTKVSSEEREEMAVAFLFAIGYTNLLFGFIDSFIGFILFFLLGWLLTAIRRMREGYRPQISYGGLIVVIALFILYALASVFFSSDPQESGSYWQRLVWLLVIPLTSSLYPFSRNTIRLFTRFSLAIGYCYMLLVFLLYLQVAYASDTPMLEFLTFDKGYFITDEGVKTSPHFLLKSFGVSHYTYLIFALSVPLLHSLIEDVSLSRIICYSVALLLLAFVLQSKLWIITLPLVLTLAMLLRFPLRRRQLVLAGSLLGVAFLMIGYANRERIVEKALQPDERVRFLEVAYNRAGEKPWFGHGLGSAERLLVEEGISGVPHFHNAFIQVYMELGVVGLCLQLGILLSAFALAIRGRKRVSLAILIALLALMCTDDLVYDTKLLFLSQIPLALYFFTQKEATINVRLLTAIKKDDEKLRKRTSHHLKTNK